jgi:3-oxoacyl-[acyl-carrier protein] reductase/2-hydroxycyclohexanecarboxyl-CoA dehydrogenase
MDLRGKVAVVTGAGRGIGAAIAQKLANDGAYVAVCDLVEENAASVASGIKAAGGDAGVYIANTANYDQVEQMFSRLIEERGHVDIVVNNAGINRDAMLHKMEIKQWDDVIAVNLTGVFYCTQQASKIMREACYGRIINIASASVNGNIGQANYSAAKAGVVGLTKTAAKELAKKGVTVNAICPGFIETEMTKGIPEKAWDIMVSKIPMGYVGKPIEVANLVAFLASDEASYITGEMIHVGGGFKL